MTVQWPPLLPATTGSARLAGPGATADLDTNYCSHPSWCPGPGVGGALQSSSAEVLQAAVFTDIRVSKCTAAAQHAACQIITTQTQMPAGMLSMVYTMTNAGLGRG